MTTETIILSLLSAIVGGLIVAFANHRMSIQREIQSKNRDLAITKLVDAWLLLCEASDRVVKKGDPEKLEEAAHLILLFGTDDQIDLIEIATKAFAKEERADWTELQVSLRRTIRKRLEISGRDRHFWFASKKIEKAILTP
jgi:hypothetical protein